MTWMRNQIAILLVAVLVLTGHSMAVARGMPTASGQMVLCTGEGPLVVPVDEQGNPTGPAHICPDCSLTVLDYVVPLSSPLVGIAGRGEKAARAPEVLQTATCLIETTARGPPCLI